MIFTTHIDVRNRCVNAVNVRNVNRNPTWWPVALLGQDLQGSKQSFFPDTFTDGEEVYNLSGGSGPYAFM